MLFLRFLFCVLLPCAALGKLDIQEQLRKIPPTEQEEIAYFFKNAVFWDSFGYVLFGYKPCAIGVQYEISWSPLSWLKWVLPHPRKLWKGWRAWRKYESLFPHPKFLLFTEKGAHTDLFVILINRNQFVQTVRQHQADFESVLGKPFEPDHLFESDHTLLSEKLQNHDGLIGTVLGYGRNNAWAFFKGQRSLDSFTLPHENEQFLTFCRKAKYNSITCQTLDLAGMPLPGFKADLNDPETIELRRLYVEARKAIQDHYREADFLLLTLELLTSQYIPLPPELCP
ncbi:MAG: hypothetical protein RL235_553 [Chlamydiota bacterium]